jgi:hypothetical protein
LGARGVSARVGRRRLGVPAGGWVIAIFIRPGSTIGIPAGKRRFHIAVSIRQWHAGFVAVGVIAPC